MNRKPNASYYSARYAERKRAQQRAADETAGPRTCNRCPEVCRQGSIFCAPHAEEYASICERGDVDAAIAFCQRAHWPEPTP